MSIGCAGKALNCAGIDWSKFEAAVLVSLFHIALMALAPNGELWVPVHASTMATNTYSWQRRCC